MSKEKKTPPPRPKVKQPPGTTGTIPPSVLAAEDVLAEREAAVHTQEQAVLSREEAADQREKVTELEAKTRDAQSSLTEAQLREANEHLIVATVRARTMADAAEQTSAQMTHMARHDFLTGLPNRMLLIDRLAQAISLARRHGKKVALMYLDIDHFKHINDSLGHEVGDRLLQSAAKRLQGCVRLSDTVSRQGGDEFVVLLPEIDELQGAVLTAEKLIEAMTEPHIIGDHRLHISLSIGISLFPDDGGDVETVIRNADIAMYHAKESGRNNYQVFTPALFVRTAARQTVEQGLQQALDQGGFFIHYQPKVNLETGAITGAEALLRWKRSDHRLACPTEFMNIAETSGLILQIGKWVLHESCRQAQVWLQAGLKLGQVAVNISTREFLGKDFLSDVSAILNDTGLDPHRLEIELTECVLMHDTQQTAATLLALKELGVQIAIDDFGTGYSSLSNLWSFPIDTLKIDQSFVQDIDGEAGEAIVSTILAMGKSLKQRVVAEGIETQDQLAFLQSLRCAEGQGFHFGRPVAAEQFATLLQAATEQQLCQRGL
jgi:diguanylate cyclase (GGDEF)-like protein